MLLAALLCVVAAFDDDNWPGSRLCSSRAEQLQFWRQQHLRASNANCTLVNGFVSDAG